MSIYVELDSMNNLRKFLNFVREQNLAILETHVNKSESIVSEGYCLNLSIRIPKKITHDQVIQNLTSGEGVFLVEELE